MVLWELLTHLKPFDGFGHFKVATKIVNGEVSLTQHVQVHDSIHHNPLFYPVCTHTEAYCTSFYLIIGAYYYL